jgi:glyoxylase-like metal-dependent hydrolase (beta-lactamase superfamily II)
MSTSSYCVKLGRFECVVVSDGFIMVAESHAPAPEPNQTPSRRRLDVQSLLLLSEERKVLIDTGCGPQHQPTSGFLLENLKKTGINPAEINAVIHTHAHKDHIGGNTDAAGRPVYGNAVHYVHKLEWDYWESRAREPEGQPTTGPDMIPAVRRNLLPLKSRYKFIGDEQQILPGFGFMLTPGHTPGSAAIIVRSSKHELFCIGDLLHSPKEFDDPGLYSRVDCDPELALRSRNNLLELLAKSGELIFASHFDFPGLGRIAKVGSSFAWEAVK